MSWPSALETILCLMTRMSPVFRHSLPRLSARRSLSESESPGRISSLKATGMTLRAVMNDALSLVGGSWQVAQVPLANQALGAGFAWGSSEKREIGRVVNVHGNAGERKHDAGFAGFFR